MHAWDLDSYCHNMDTGKAADQDLSKSKLNQPIPPYTYLKYVMTGLVICIMVVMMRNHKIV